MTEPMFSPEQFAHRSGDCGEENQLRRWLRSLPSSQRIAFIKALWPSNGRFALSLVRSSQLSVQECSSLLRYWLSLGQHNAAQALIKELEPALGKERFWKIVKDVELTPAMREFLNYYSRGELERRNG